MVAVVLFHAFPDAVPGGFVGVDIFFVLSGFLITSMLMVEHRSTGRIDLRAFWIRRVRRLVPAVVVLVLVTGAIGLARGTTSPRWLYDSIGALTWSTNWFELGIAGSTWRWIDDSTVIDHLWSLAIEEQFYLVWPLLLWPLLRRFSSAQRFAFVALGLCVPSMVIMGWLDQVVAYFRTDARAFELLIGALGAFVGHRCVRSVRTPVLIGALIALLVFVRNTNPNMAWLYPWGFIGVSVVSVFVVVSLVEPPRWAERALTTAPIRYLGQVSYGVYLWHIPVIRFLSEKALGFGGIGLVAVQLAALIGAVEVSRRFVEKPLRTPGSRPPIWLVGAVVVSIGLVFAGLQWAAQKDFERKWDFVSVPVVDRSKATVLLLGDLGVDGVDSQLRSTGGVQTWKSGEICAFTSPSIQLSGGVLEQSEWCEHWQSRWRNAIAAFRPTLTVVVEGTWETRRRVVDGHELTAEELRPIYAEFAQRQVDLADDAKLAFVIPVNPSGIDPDDDPDARRLRSEVFVEEFTRATRGCHSCVLLTPDGSTSMAVMAASVRDALVDHVGAS